MSARAHNLCDHDAWRSMKGTRFAQFSAEVLQRGAAAVLPQHLPDRWLDALLEEADLFTPEEWDPQEGDHVHECCAGLLGGCPRKNLSSWSDHSCCAGALRR
jgi:hypothetical protein